MAGVRACWPPPALGNPVTELRIDVMLPLVDGELEAIYERLCQPGNRLHGLPQRPLHDPQFTLHWREADGEWFAYVEDRAGRRLAGYVVFNRLVEVDRRTDRRVRSPHARFAPGYQRRGIASAVYRQVLDQGIHLLSGARQSPGAHGLWNHLARSHESHYVTITDAKQLAYLGPQRPPDAVFDQRSTRRLLLANGCSLHAFAQATRMGGGGA
ncbi:N-acetyltransferase [Comamonas serinivorans]|uniref:N-acetyltransferase n=1 Tax=Comamonas serinivorans TaxID=1082851 RepID=A0A1Y0ETL5_9BURK|nr:N-acetyltransferase [Comamonas serinivorans]